MLIKRLFAAGSVLPHDMVRFIDHQGTLAPDHWSSEAVLSFQEALFHKAAKKTSAIEENTMPSWLWAHKAASDQTKIENSVTDVFDRIAGSATHLGWKLGLWKNETEASSFYDEVRAVLLTRRLIFAPKDMAKLGLDWAYGQNKNKDPENTTLESGESANLILQNETIDNILGKKSPAARNKWLRFLETSQTREKTTISFADTMAEWNVHPVTQTMPRSMINLMAFRQIDGSIDMAGLEQTARLAVLLIELHYETLAQETIATRPMALGFCNLSGLLMALGLAYDSKEARGVASALAGLITASAYSTSAQLAGKLGPCAAYLANRETIMRNMENQIRAAFGEKNDYDRLSVLPQTLDVESGIDLVLLSDVRHAYEKAHDVVRENGLRHTQMTALFKDNDMMLIAGSFAQGIEAQSALACEYMLNNDQFDRRINPSVAFALSHLGYDHADCRAVSDHLTGYKTLVAAPGLSLLDLREKGFDENALSKVEESLSQVRHIRFAFTPWVLGLDFCEKNLGIQTADLKNPAFDLLRHLGFTNKQIETANRFCCGHATIQGNLEIRETDQSVFVTAADLGPESMIRMAAAVQSFVMGDVALSLPIPTSITAQVRGELLLMAWKQGLRSLSLTRESLGFVEELGAPAQVIMKRKTKTGTARHAANHQTKKSAQPASRHKAKAPTRTVSFKSKAGKAPLKEKQN